MFAPPARFALAFFLHAFILCEAVNATMCHRETFGDTSTLPVPLEPVYIRAGQRDAQIVLVEDEVCLYGYGLAGVSVEVCDADVAPDVRVQALTSTLVHRRGALRYDAVITTQVYCALHH